jgi:hypothetical protein
MIIHPWIERPFDSSFCTLVTFGIIFILKLDQQLLNQTQRWRWYHNAESTVTLVSSGQISQGHWNQWVRLCNVIFHTVRLL